MILCGGLGRRLLPLTGGRPKVLLEVGGRTLLDLQLSLYRRAGVGVVYLLEGHGAGEIRRRYGREWRGVELRHVAEGRPMGTMHALAMGMRAAWEDGCGFCVGVASNGDVVTDFDLAGMVEGFRGSGMLASVLAVRMRSPYGVLRVRGGRVTAFEEKHLLPHHINGGFYCLALPLVWWVVRNKHFRGDAERTLFPYLAETGRLGAHFGSPRYWVSVDTPKDLEEARRLIKGRTR
jgi:NDP-sugar pyrophosphorylase family protein